MNRETLVYIADELNSTKSTWAIGGSLLLFHHGIINVVNDLDIIVKTSDIEKIVRKLRNIGQEREVYPLPPYHTTYYYEFNVKDISMDVMSDFKIKHEEGLYTLPFTEHSVEYYIVNGVNIPFCTLEDWYILYQLIPGREEKVKLIESYFLNNGVKNRDLLERAMSGILPKPVVSRVENLLEI